MIDYKSHTLANGLTVLAHRDSDSRMVAVNMLYKVGSRNENPSRTGFAHLFEHLMFRGTKAIPSFDTPVQEACGENNAFTNSDYTDYYMTLPRENLSTALWLESDRMTGLNITTEALEGEKKVVIEEYNQRYLNQPYGDQLLLLKSMAYRVHPYRWATIGLNIDHIAGASVEEVRDFYERFYTPSNAILSIAGDIEESEIIDLAERWFGDIPRSNFTLLPLPEEPLQTEARRMEVVRDVPTGSITVAFVMGDRLSSEYYVCDMITDILAGGTSSRLNQNLTKKHKIFSRINAYVSGDLDRGLFVVTGQLQEGVSSEKGELAIWNELTSLQKIAPSDYEMNKVKNKFESTTIFGELNVMNKAVNLGFYSMLGDLSLLNGEIAIFRAITAADIMATATTLFCLERSITLIYRPESPAK